MCAHLHTTPNMVTNVFVHEMRLFEREPYLSAQDRFTYKHMDFSIGYSDHMIKKGLFKLKK